MKTKQDMIDFANAVDVGGINKAMLYSAHFRRDLDTLCGVRREFLGLPRESTASAIRALHAEAGKTLNRILDEQSRIGAELLRRMVEDFETRARFQAMADEGLRKVDAILFGTFYEDWLEASPERRSDLAFYGGKRWSNGISAGCLPAKPLVLNRIAEPHAYPKRNHGV